MPKSQENYQQHFLKQIISNIGYESKEKLKSMNIFFELTSNLQKRKNTMISDQMSVLNSVALCPYDLWRTSMQSYSHFTEHALHVIVTSYHYWVCSNLNMWNFDHGTISTCVRFVLFLLFCVRFRFRFRFSPFALNIL